MPRNMKPSVKSHCPAAHYAASDERIVEFSIPLPDGGVAGGLISFRIKAGGVPTVDIYNIDPSIRVQCRGKTIEPERVK